MIRRLLYILMGSLLLGVAQGDPVPVRVAVISDADDKDLAALITAELSGNPDIALVERDDLAKVGDEAKVQQLASSEATALGKLIRADGLLFLGREGDIIHARLTAVGLGYALFDLQIAAGVDQGETVKSISHRIGQVTPKLRLAATQAIPISILNLRFDLATPDSPKMERDLTLLLESRLASIPNDVVLERRHAWDLGFEHSLTPTPATPLLEGAYVVDGTLSIRDPKSGEIRAQLHLRPPNSTQETPLEVSGRSDDLNGLVESMVGQINKAIGSPVVSSTWQPQAEAREYLHEGIWAWEHGQQQASVEALDSAELLGETAPDLFAVRIQALCQLAVPDMNPWLIEFINVQVPPREIYEPVNAVHHYSPPSSLPDRLAFAKRAMADFAIYREPSGLRSYHLQFIDPKWQHNVQLAYTEAFVVHAASQVLTELDQQNDPETEAFREQVRQLAGFDPLNGKFPLDRGDAAFFADEWAHSLDEEKAYDQTILSREGLSEQFEAVSLKMRLVWDRGMIFCPRFIKDPTDQRKAFQEFMQNLEQTPEGKLSALLILMGDNDRSVEEASYPAFYDELAGQGDRLLKTNELLAHCLAAYELHNDLYSDKFGAHAIPILRRFLTESNQWDIRTLQVLWNPASFPSEDAPAIWNEFKAYKARILNPNGTVSPYAFQENAMFGALEDRFTKAFPQPAEAPKNPLVVTKFWQPGFDEHDSVFFHAEACATDSGFVAVKGAGSRGNDQRIYVLHPPDFDSVAVHLPPSLFSMGFCFDANAIYATAVEWHPDQAGSTLDHPWQLYRYDRTSQTWENHEIPLLFSTPHLVRDKLYITIASGNGGRGAITQYDWDQSTLTILASDSRRPAQNQFDDRTGYQVLSLFPGLNNTVGTNIDFKCFTVSEKPGNWPEIVSGFDAQRAAPMGETTLLEDYRNHLALLIDPAKPQPEILLAPLQVPLPPALAAYGAAQWQMDPTTISKIFDRPKGWQHNAFFALMQDGPKPAQYKLLWFDSAHNGNPVTIPLQFKMDESMEAYLKKAGAPLSKSGDAAQGTLDTGLDQLVSTDAGICLMGTAGVWFIPFDDIDAYLKSLSN